MASKKILVVDDEPETLVYLEKILDRAGYAVVAASSGQEALDVAKRDIPDAIILDIILGDMRGEDVKNALAHETRTKHIPVIFITGILSKEEQAVFQKLGNRISVLAKPVVCEELLRILDKTIGIQAS